MNLFKKSLCFDYPFFKFKPVGENFTIRRGVKKSMEEGEYFYLKGIPVFGEYRMARHLKTQVMRFCDIPSFDKWHLSSGESDPFKVMENLYAGFEKDEIVTLIWFQVC